jgi:beta-glucosidase
MMTKRLAWIAIGFAPSAGCARTDGQVATQATPTKSPIKQLAAAQSAYVESLIASMTPDQKVAQLHGVWLKDLIKDGKLDLEACRKRIPHGVGFVAQFSSSTTLRPDELASVVADLQRYLMTEAAPGIPAVFQEEAITGFSARGATTYPQQIGMSCTWNAELIRENARTTALNMRLAGATQCLSPMLDVIDNATWGRAEEGFGEEPYLVSLLGLAFIEGLQGNDLRTGIATTAKHFAGYGGQDEAIGAFMTDTLMPHEAAVRLGNSAAVMPGYHRFQGVPCHVSPFLLLDVLRDRWAFDGMVCADFGAVGQVHGQFKYTPGPLETAKATMQVQMDVELPTRDVFNVLPQAMRNGVIPIDQVDRSLHRVLTLKTRLGLIGPGAIDTTRAKPGPLDFDPPAFQQRAEESARQSLVLLSNNGLLPLKADGDGAVRRVALVGPNADSYYALLGDYTYQMMAEFWWRHPVDASSPRLVTLRTGLQERLPPGVTLAYERGCDWTAPLRTNLAGETQTLTEGDQRARDNAKHPLEQHPAPDLDRALKIAAESDVIIAAVGETRYLCGESVGRKGIALPGEQQQFVEQLLATGKPVVLVVFGGRPMVLTDIADRCAAVVYAWYPGQAGGHAVADLLWGRFNPSGRLTVTLPRHESQVPISARQGYTAEKSPLFPLGHGLTFTRFDYADLKMPGEIAPSADAVEVSFRLTNTGARGGVEVAQIYAAARDCQPGEPARQLVGFARCELAPGESRDVHVRIALDQLSRFVDLDRLSVRAGMYAVFVGASSTDVRLSGDFSIARPRTVDARKRKLFSEVRQASNTK